MSAKTRILVVDDNALLVEVLTSVLDMEGDLEVVGDAGSGEEALEKAVALRPDLIFLDMKLPGMSGEDTGRGLKAALPNTKLIVMSGYSEADLQDACLFTGADRFLLKSGDFDEVIGTVRQVLGQAPRRPIPSA